MCKTTQAAIISSIMVFCFLLSGCNTVQGLGKDMQKGGQELQKAAQPNTHSQS